MMKFLRKYNKHLLAIFMAGLLVAWLTGEALRQLLTPDETAQVVARVYGKPVKLRDLTPYYRQAQTLTELGLRWQTIWQLSLYEAGVHPMMVRFEREALSEQEWYMLVTWARRQGIEISPKEVADFRQQLNKEAPRVEFVRQRHGASLEEIDTAIADFLRVLEAVRRQASAVVVTEPELRRRMREVGEKVTVKFLPIPSRVFQDEKTPIPAEELQAQFDQYKDVAAGEGKPYGYRLPAQVRIEYVSASIDDVARQIKIDEQRAYSYWKEHKSEFLKPEPTPATQTAPASRPAPQPYERFDEARADVIAKLQEQEAEKEVLALMRDFISRLNQAWQTAATGADGYLIPPDAVKAADYLSREVDVFAKRRFGNTLKWNRTELLTQTALMSTPGLGQAATVDSRRPTPLHSLAFEVQGLAENKKDDPTAPSEGRLALFQPAGSPLRDPQKNVYMFRVVEVLPSRPPASVEEVKADVERDVREIRAHKAAGEVARRLADAAADAGLAEALEAEATLRERLGPEGAQVREATFARQRLGQFFEGRELRPSMVPFIGQDEGFIREAFRLAAAGPTTRPQRVTVVELQAPKRWAVIQWVATVPVLENEYESRRMELVSSLYTDDVAAFIQDFYSPEQIKARVGWEARDSREGSSQADAT